MVDGVYRTCRINPITLLNPIIFLIYTKNQSASRGLDFYFQEAVPLPLDRDTTKKQSTDQYQQKISIMACSEVDDLH